MVHAFGKKVRTEERVTFLFRRVQKMSTSSRLIVKRTKITQHVLERNEEELANTYKKKEKTWGMHQEGGEKKFITTAPADRVESKKTGD